MMQKCCFLLLLIFLVLRLQVNAQMIGLVKDKQTGNPIANASIYISDERKGTTTNESGQFVIYHISEGNHLIEISHIGYGSIADQINIHGETKLSFELTQAVLENNAVIVTGVTKATQIKKIPFAVSVFKKDDLLKTASTNIIESIGKLPGVSTVSTGPAISKPQIRGLGYKIGRAHV